MLLPLVWAACAIAGSLYALHQNIPWSVALKAFPAFLLEATFFYALAVERMRARIEKLKPTAIALALVLAAVAPYGAASIAFGTFHWRAFLPIAVLAAAASFWYVLAAAHRRIGRHISGVHRGSMAVENPAPARILGRFRNFRSKRWPRPCGFAPACSRWSASAARRESDSASGRPRATGKSAPSTIRVPARRRRTGLVDRIRKTPRPDKRTAVDLLRCSRDIFRNAVGAGARRRIFLPRPAAAMDDQMAEQRMGGPGGGVAGLRRGASVVSAVSELADLSHRGALLGLCCGLAFRTARGIRAPMVTHALVVTTWRIFFG